MVFNANIKEYQVSISITRYVNVNSQVGGAAAALTRDLIARLFTSYNGLSPDAFLQFSSAADVGSFFGTSSEEYYRALFYFNWTSKNLESPDAIQFARWVTDNTAPKIYSIPSQTQTLADWQAISAGSFGITIDGDSQTFSGLDFTAAASLNDVSDLIQSEIQLVGGAAWATATVVYDSTTEGFIFTGGDAVASTITVQPALSGDDISGINLLGWYPQATYPNNIFNSALYLTGANWVNGQIAESITDVLTTSTALSNNFGSFLFLNNLELDQAQVVEAATWNQAQNVQFLYSIPVVSANISGWSTALANIGGCSLTYAQTPLTATATLAADSEIITGLVDATTTYTVGQYVTGIGIPYGTTIFSITDDTTIVLNNLATTSGAQTLTFWIAQYPEMAPTMIEASTNYSKENSVQNYMFQIFPLLNPTVFDTSTANAYDALSINYYGQTQNAGTPINFYQRGLMQGTATSPLDQNTYVNELWLKDQIIVAFMNLLLGVNQLPANSQGKGLALLTLQGVINQALKNGVISVGKTLTSLQIEYINNVTGTNTAWYQVQNSGYWVDANVTEIPDVLPTQYQISYTLIYSKDDVIRKVSGQDILI